MQHVYELGIAGKFYIPFEELEIDNSVFNHGEFSEIHLCRWRGIDIVIKQPIQSIDDFLREIEVWSTIRHPLIAQFLGFSIKDDSVIILLEKINGITLTQYLKKWKIFNKESISKQLIQIIYFLHSCNPSIIYRDLKPDNILIDTNGNVKLVDFGLSRFIEKPIEPTKMTGGTGTLRYMAPEIVKNLNYDTRADIYSLGIVLMYIWTGNKPLEFVDFKEYIKSGKNLYFFLRNKKWFDIISKCTDYNYTKRPFAKDLINMI
jgi:serine/threonine protein kinase